MATPEQIAAAKAEGYSDEEIQQFLGGQTQAAQVAQAKGGNIAAPGSRYDPSQGGGQLDIQLPWHTFHTGISTPGWLDRGLAGAGRGMEHTVQSVGDLFGSKDASAALAENKNTDAPLMATTAGKVGNFVGESAATAPLGMIGGGAVGKMIPALRGALAQGAIQGGIQGVATADPGDRGMQGAMGAVAGGAVPMLAKGTKALINGLKRTPEAQRLLDSGIDLTPGQMNPHGVINMLENTAETVPGAKQIVHPARDQAESQIHALMIQHGAAPGTTIKPSNDIAEMLTQAHDSYAPLYDQAKGFPMSPKIMTNTARDIPLSDAFKAASKTPGVPSSIQNTENQWLQNRLTMLDNRPGGLQSEHMLDLRSEIRQRAREASLKTDLNSGHVQTINKKAADQVTKALESQLPDEPLNALRTADSTYGRYKILEDAVANSKDQTHGLTPKKLSQAIADATQSGAYARGAGGDLRQLAKDSAAVLDPVIPPTGARNAIYAGTVGAGFGAPHIALPAGAAMLASIGSRTGRAAAQGKLAPQRYAQMMQNNFNSAVPEDARSAAGDLVASHLSGLMRPAVPGAALGTAAFLTHRFQYPWEKKKEDVAEVSR